MKLPFSRTGAVLLSLFLFLPLACLPGKKMAVISVGPLLEDVAKASSKQSDLRLIHEGLPAYLLLMDGMVEAWPGNAPLLIATAQAYASYASIYEEVSAGKGNAREEQEDYISVLYGKARKYALKSLEGRGLKKPAEISFDDFKEGVQRLGKRDLPYLFWTASCWARWISLNLSSMEALAELPKVEALMKRVLEVDETYYHGGAHLFMGIWFASKPKGLGQDLKRAQDHFLRAIEIGQGKFLMAYVYYAEYYARKAMDKDLFVSALQRVQETPPDTVPDLTLLNALAKKKAIELKGRFAEWDIE